MTFEDFVRARSSSLLRTAMLLVGQNRAEAEDLLQVALERAYRYWPRVINSEEPERYVRRILANASADRWRRIGRRPEPAMPAFQAAVMPDRTAELAERDYLLRALAGLPRGQRAVLVLRYFDDLSEGETARMLGCSVGTVKSQTARALGKLRAYFTWQNGGHRLVIAVGPNIGPGPDQLAYWQPGEAHLHVATILSAAEMEEIQTGTV